MKKIIIAGMALVLTGIALVSTGCDNNDLKQPKTYIIPNVNYQEVIQLNPLYQGGK